LSLTRLSQQGAYIRLIRLLQDAMGTQHGLFFLRPV